MQTLQYRFEPLAHGFDNTLFAAFALAVAMGLVAFWAYKSPKFDVNRRNIILMLCLFVGFLSFGTGVWKAFSHYKLKPIELHTTHIVTPYGTANWRDIRDFYIKMERHHKPMQPNVVRDSARFIFIMERNDKTHVLSEGDYPIDSILVRMNEIMGY